MTDIQMIGIEQKHYNEGFNAFLLAIVALAIEHRNSSVMTWME